MGGEAGECESTSCCFGRWDPPHLPAPVYYELKSGPSFAGFPRTCMHGIPWKKLLVRSPGPPRFWASWLWSCVDAPGWNSCRRDEPEGTAQQTDRPSGYQDPASSFFALEGSRQHRGYHWDKNLNVKVWVKTEHQELVSPVLLKRYNN